MSRKALIRQIKEKAEQDARNRRDTRFLDTMGFLVAKGFLRTNMDIPLMPNKRLRVADAIWAGQMVEPRILEVLPAAVLRLRRHFDLDPKHQELITVMNQLKNREEKGKPFMGIPYEKIRMWAELPLRDRRVKPVGRKKILKTFRLEPEVVENLRVAAKDQGCTETEVLEMLLRSPRETGLG